MPKLGWPGEGGGHSGVMGRIPPQNKTFADLYEQTSGTLKKGRASMPRRGKRKTHLRRSLTQTKNVVSVEGAFQGQVSRSPSEPWDSDGREGGLT